MLIFIELFKLTLCKSHWIEIWFNNRRFIPNSYQSTLFYRFFKSDRFATRQNTSNRKINIIQTFGFVCPLLSWSNSLLSCGLMREATTLSALVLSMIAVFLSSISSISRCKWTYALSLSVLVCSLIALILSAYSWSIRSFTWSNDSTKRGLINLFSVWLSSGVIISSSVWFKCH